jgi:uncharacterized protein (DUF1778 family)
MALGLRTERISARLLPEQKRRIELAARINGSSVSGFWVQKADEATRKAIEAHTTWTLTEQDWELFMKALLDPPEPNERLKAAAKRYREIVRDK